jgi:hypothetical protein
VPRHFQSRRISEKSGKIMGLPVARGRRAGHAQKFPPPGSCSSCAEKALCFDPEISPVYSGNFVAAVACEHGPLLLINIELQEDIDRQFFGECYCESGALSQHALLTKQMLNARYSSLFPA